MPLPLEPVLAKLHANRAGAIERWQELLRFPSIGTDPSRDADTRRAAEWLALQLRQIGFEASLRATGGQPMVVGHQGAQTEPEQGASEHAPEHDPTGREGAHRRSGNRAALERAPRCQSAFAFSFMAASSCLMSAGESCGRFTLIVSLLNFADSGNGGL